MAAKKSEKQQLDRLNTAITEALVERVVQDPLAYIDELPPRERSELLKRKVTQAKSGDEATERQVIELHEALRRLPDVGDLRKELDIMRALVKKQEGQIHLAHAETELWRGRAAEAGNADGIRCYITTFCRYDEEYFSELRNRFLSHDDVKRVLKQLTEKGVIDEPVT